MGVRGRLGAVTAATLVAAMAAGGAAAQAAPAEPVEAGITVPRVEGMGADWINGADFSTVLSLEESGVTFKDRQGQEADLFEVLADAGVNWARVRVWNEPFLSTDPTKGYGAGNVDAERATEIGRRATEAGMRVLVDFHYSDFWAHPGQQYAPRAWRDMDLTQRTQALYDYTAETLQTMEDAGVDVGMVQIGNETTGGEIAGTRGWDSTAQLFQAGSRAVRDTLGPDVKVAVHFTNPERAGQYASVAKALDDRGVDYDVFLSSYYAFWHGSPENLTSVLTHVAQTYDKEVAVAETSYTYTLADGDGYPNAVRTAAGPYPASVQGQALAIRDVMQAVADVPDGKGLGTFYWEPAWLPVGPPDQAEANWELWQRDGSGWATTYSQEFYDPTGALGDEWADDFGGSGWDNQALFAFDGTPLESLRVYEYARTGSVGPRELDAVQEAQVTVADGDPVTLPSTVDVSYTDGTTEAQEVTWHGSTGWIVGPGVYTVTGTTSAGHDAVATVTVLGDASQAANLVVNPGFEAGVAPWTGTGTGYTISSPNDPFAGSRSLHFWSGSAYAFSVEQTIRDVPPGRYRLSAKVQGGDAGAADTVRISASSGISSVTADARLQGFVNWQTPQTEPIDVAADGVVVVSANLSLSGGAWGSMDEFSLVAVPDEAAADTAALAALVQDAEGLDRDAWTPASLEALDAALARAAFVLASPRPGQASVDAAAEQLSAALGGLVAVVPTPQPTTSPQPTSSPQPTTSPAPTPSAPAVQGTSIAVSATTVRPGDRLTVTVTDAPGTQVEVGVASAYRALATATLVDGAATVTVTVPGDLAPGVHHVQARGADGTVLAQVEIRVLGDGTLAVTGTSVLVLLGAALALLAGGAVLVVHRRRRTA
ncbi:glycosyl hydrolase 53 family protein [Cellulomonas telluris]|uniref:glycosyl hydrolase 53 family protein n=1 Tax=Cellulomonas telluris TaxID=2306636 RepID=UPI0014562BFA|nr:glycosyl hydrolase 53 family protein [Cellulomonas telluris]